MKKLPTIIKFPILIIINVFVCALDIIFYTNGAMDNLLCFLPLALLLTGFNYWLCNKTWLLIAIQSLATVSCFICNAVSFSLYDKYVSSDTEGYVVAALFLFGQVAIFTSISVVAVVIKRYRIAKMQKEPNVEQNN